MICQCVLRLSCCLQVARRISHSSFKEILQSAAELKTGFVCAKGLTELPGLWDLFLLGDSGKWSNASSLGLSLGLAGPQECAGKLVEQ